MVREFYFVYKNFSRDLIKIRELKGCWKRPILINVNVIIYKLTELANSTNPKSYLFMKRTHILLA